MTTFFCYSPLVGIQFEVLRIRKTSFPWRFLTNTWYTLFARTYGDLGLHLLPFLWKLGYVRSKLYISFLLIQWKMPLFPWNPEWACISREFSCAFTGIMHDSWPWSSHSHLSQTLALRLVKQQLVTGSQEDPKELLFATKWGPKLNVRSQFLLFDRNNLGQYDRPRVLGCKPVDGVLVVLSSNQFSSNQINIPTSVHQMGDTHLPSGEQT